ncbi:MAG: response regulator, partial [Pyrinomonadaceae bacterium]|nr:response regulator [Pyrinomonadaceae bacterium]
LSLHPEEVETTSFLEGIVEPLRGEAALRGVELNISVREPEMLLHVDARQARRALCHVLTAALAATPDGGAVNIAAQAIKGTRVGDEGRRFIIINIIDSGAGIPAEEVPFIFDAFWQAGGNNRAGAQGVGLAIARRIAAAHGGNITVRSQLGVGTVYSLVFPASQAATFAEQRRVLVVDDVPDIMLLLGKLVERMGYQVETACCATEALEILELKKIDLLITDWAMPGMSGGELIAKLKQDARWRDIPSIVLTGHDTEAERDGALMAGCDCFLVKPVKRDKLQSVINEFLSAVPLTQ